MNIELCRAGEVADALGIKLDTLYRYARKGRIRGMKVGKAWRFSQADVQDFLQQHQYRVKPDEDSSPALVQPTLLPDILRRAALESGVQRAITCGGAEASYADVDNASNQLADSLLSHGVVPGDRVLLLLSNSPEFIAACFAVWKAGAILVVEDPSIKDEDLGHLARDCAPQALIADRDVAERLDVRRDGLEDLRLVCVKGPTSRLSGLDGARVESLDTALENKAAPALVRFNSSSPDDIATITWPPGVGRGAKGVMNSHLNWLAGAAFTAECRTLSKQDVLVLPLPLHQSMALRQMLAYVLAGARIILASDLQQAVKLMKDQRPSALALRPEDVTPLLEKFAPALQKVAGTLRHLELASAPLEEGELRSLRRLLPKTAIHLNYNLTEAQAAFLSPGADGSLNGPCRIPPTLSLRIVDEQGRDVRPGRSGRILLKGPGLMSGFWGQSDLEMALLKSEGWCSGDHAICDKGGKVTLPGRLEETLDIRGHKVRLSEVEAVLRRHIRVAECAVVALLDMNGGFDTKLHAFVVPTAKGALLTEREMKDYCRTFLQSHKMPERIHFRRSLPKSADGQILRESLKAAAQCGAGSELATSIQDVPELLATQS